VICALAAPGTCFDVSLRQRYVAAVLQSARGPRISGWYEDVSVYTLIYNILAYNKVVNLHDYVEYGLGKVSMTLHRSLE
jgi:hypothetical protein